MSPRVLAAAAAAFAAAAAAAPAPCAQPLLNPAACCTLTAPKVFNATFDTTAGAFTLTVTRSAAPLGADRFYNLAYYGYFGNATVGGNENGFFRFVPGFVVQFGIAGVPAVSAAWNAPPIKDDPVVLSNTVGTIAFATAGPDTRTTQLFINLGDNSGLDAQGFAPFGVVTAGYDVVSTQLYQGYGEQPDQDQIYSDGDAYLRRAFPKLSYTLATSVVTVEA